MRNLNTEELKLVYGGGGGCAPKPPKCKGGSRGGGTKSRSKSHGSKSHGSKSGGSKSGSKSCSK